MNQWRELPGPIQVEESHENPNSASDGNDEDDADGTDFDDEDKYEGDNGTHRHDSSTFEEVMTTSFNFGTGSYSTPSREGAGGL